MPYLSTHDPPPAYQEKAITRLLDGRGYHTPGQNRGFRALDEEPVRPQDYAIVHLPKTKNKKRMEEPMEDRLGDVRLTSIKLEPRTDMPSSGCTCSALIW